MYSGRTDERMYTVTGRKTSVLSISHDCKFMRKFFVSKFCTFPCGLSRTKTPPCVPFSCVFYKCFLFYGDWRSYTFYVLCHRCALVYRPMIFFKKKSYIIIIDRFNSILSNQNDFRDSFVNEVNVIRTQLRRQLVHYGNVDGSQKRVKRKCCICWPLFEIEKNIEVYRSE